MGTEEKMGKVRNTSMEEMGKEEGKGKRNNMIVLKVLVSSRGSVVVSDLSYRDKRWYAWSDDEACGCECAGEKGKKILPEGRGALALCPFSGRIEEAQQVSGRVFYAL